MKIVVIGGSGLIGSKLVHKLNAQGHQAIPASPRSGVNTLTGEGLTAALEGALVVVDVSNSPSFEATAVMDFFQKSTRNLLTQAAAAGVHHYVALSVVGTDRSPDSGYFLAKLAQEKLIQESPVPYSIVRATQFFEFVKSIADAATVGGEIRVSPMPIQPMAAEDVADEVARITLGSPMNAVVEIAGPDRFRMDDLIRQFLAAGNDPRALVVDPEGRYFGASLNEHTLVPRNGARLGATHFADWLKAGPPK